MAASVIRLDSSLVFQIGLFLLANRRTCGFHATSGHHLRNEPSFHVEETHHPLPRDKIRKPRKYRSPSPKGVQSTKVRPPRTEMAAGADPEALFNGTPMKLVNGGVNRRCYTYIDDAIECTYRIVLNRGGVCDRQIFNIGSPNNEISIRQMAEMMREIYAAKFRDVATSLPEILSVSGEEFYGEGYDDSDRRIPDIAKARALLGWEPVWNVRDTIDATMGYHVAQYRKNLAGGKGIRAGVGSAPPSGLGPRD